MAVLPTPGNVCACPVHLKTAAVSYVGPFRVDLNMARWYQKRVGLVGFFQFQGNGRTFALNIYASRGQ